MKKLILIIILFFSIATFGQKVKAEAIRHTEVTTVERDAFVVPVGEYWKIYNTTTNKFEHWNGTIWVSDSTNSLEVKDEGISTLGGLKIWFDEVVFRLSTEERGLYLGEFKGDDKIKIKLEPWQNGAIIGLVLGIFVSKSIIARNPLSFRTLLASLTVFIKTFLSTRYKQKPKLEAEI